MTSPVTSLSLPAFPPFPEGRLSRREGGLSRREGGLSRREGRLSRREGGLSTASPLALSLLYSSVATYPGGTRWKDARGPRRRRRIGFTSPACALVSTHARSIPGVYSKYSRWSTSKTSSPGVAARVRAAVRPAKPPPRTATRVGGSRARALRHGTNEPTLTTRRCASCPAADMVSEQSPGGRYL